MLSSAYSKGAVNGSQGYFGDDYVRGLTKQPQEWRNGEFAFLISKAKECGGPVLDLATGGGRIPIILAEAGFECVGFDASFPMLEFAKRAVKKLPVNIRKKISFVQGDMCGFDFSERFPLIINAFQSFWYNFSHAALEHPDYKMALKNNDSENQIDKIIERVMCSQAEGCIRSIMRSLRSNGNFIIDAPDHSGQIEEYA